MSEELREYDDRPRWSRLPDACNLHLFIPGASRDVRFTNLRVQQIRVERGGEPVDAFDVLHNADGTLTAWAGDTIIERKAALRRRYADVLSRSRQ